ncbi:alpha/beta hydrolase family esterase [Draconibacterium halophilum]|uniref:Prolyl oligopeptidase family serine peptidase n=1 Tax=Draconibacterium halophilum TaxID=2706887 RepID=A0A6C0RIK4_9BACT|nr:PHB depolymerase family esterase [Draconibacterium halophilum]QIA09682.1 prolyl oligopeptidase family serine peptidase [Draconibacterium halophilum]
MYKILFSIPLIFLAELSFSQRWTETIHVKVDGLERNYELFVPKNYSEGKDYPIVFILHGGGGKSSRMPRFTRYRFNELAARDGFIAVYPNGYRKGWNDGDRDTLTVARRLNIDDVGFFDAMIDDLDRKLSIDSERIFACGISNGGFMVQRLAIERSKVFKAIGVVAANMSEDQQTTVPGNPVPVIFICGTSDPLVPYNGGPVMVLKQKRGEVVSVDESVRFWKEQNDCSELAEARELPDIIKTDDCSVYKTVWQNPDDPNIRVVNIRIENGGHTWPGTRQYLPTKLIGNTNQDIDGCEEIWEFFNSVKIN